MKAFTPVYIGTPTNPTDEDLIKARTLAQVLVTQGCLPIMPFVYQGLFDPSADDYRSMCAAMFKQCREAIFIGQPTGEMARLCKRHGVTVRCV